MRSSETTEFHRKIFHRVLPIDRTTIASTSTIKRISYTSFLSYSTLYPEMQMEVHIVSSAGFSVAINQSPATSLTPHFFQINLGFVRNRKNFLYSKIHIYINPFPISPTLRSMLMSYVIFAYGTRQLSLYRAAK